MNILDSKQYRSFDRVSRYSSVPIYYNREDKKYQTGTTSWLNSNTKYTTYRVKSGDTLDKIALEMYNNPTYYWVICDFNRITDPFIDLRVGSYLNIPVLSKISFEES